MKAGKSIILRAGGCIGFEDLASGVFCIKSLVLLSEDLDTAFHSLGCRKWAVQTVPLDICNGHDDQLLFTVPAPLPPDSLQQPHWVVNNSACVEDTRWKACSVEVLHPACLEARLRRHTCVLRQCTPVEPVVKAALRTGECFLDRPTLERVCKVNKAAAIPTDKTNKKGKASFLKVDFAKALIQKIFPEFDPESSEFKRILSGIVLQKQEQGLR